MISVNYYFFPKRKLENNCFDHMFKRIDYLSIVSYYIDTWLTLFKSMVDKFPQKEVCLINDFV